jgi:hypothetical protein
MTIPMENQKANTIAEHLVKKVYSKYGPPERVLTDQGTNFLSKLISHFSILFKIKQIKTTSYHPQTDGLVERFNRTLCDMLACYVNEEPEFWDLYHDFVKFAYNTSQHSSIDSCPINLNFKRNPIIPNDIAITQNVEVFEDDDDYERHWRRALEYSKEKLEKAQVKQKQSYDQGSKLVKLNINDHVLLKPYVTTGKFSNRRIGPFIISKKLSDLNYEIIKLINNVASTLPKNKFVVHVNRIKLVTEKPNEVVVSDITPIIAKRRGKPPSTGVIPKRRGRPPKIPQPPPNSNPEPEPYINTRQNQNVINQRYNLRKIY